MQALWNNIKHESLHITGVSEGEEREKMKIQTYKIYGTQQSYSNGIGTKQHGIGTKADIHINGTENRDNKYTHTTTDNLWQKRQQYTMEKRYCV